MSATKQMPERDEEHERLLSIVFDISPAQAAILSLLCRAAPATTEQVKEFADLKSDPKSVIWHLRSKLSAYDVELKSRRAIGYWIERDDREKVQQRTDTYISCEA